MTLAEILNDVLAQSGFLEKSSFTGTSDPDDRQMVAIANRTQTEIRDYYPWSFLRATFSVFPPPGSDNPDGDEDSVPTGSTQTSFPLPADFRSFIPDSVWEIDGSRMLEWPVPTGRWYLYKFSDYSSGGIGRIRQYGNTIQVQTPGSWQPFEFEYISKYAIRSGGTGGAQGDFDDAEIQADFVSAGQPVEYFQNDNDTTVIDDRLLMLGIQANWAEVKMFPQAGLWKNNYMQKMNEAIGRDTGGRVISTGPGPGRRNDPYYPLWRPAAS